MRSPVSMKPHLFQFNLAAKEFVELPPGGRSPRQGAVHQLCGDGAVIDCAQMLLYAVQRFEVALQPGAVSRTEEFERVAQPLGFDAQTVQLLFGSLHADKLPPRLEIRPHLGEQFAAG